ncbi:MAG: hypothetical protein J1G02_01835 [Clostridiales bacterium]|nr:hypothetical protein [Clostridiales bacterium]
MVGVLINIGISLIIVIAAIVGLATGFCRQFSKPLVGIIAIISAVILTMILYPLIFSTGIFDGFVAKACGWFKPEFYQRPVTDVESFQAAISDNYLRVLSGASGWVFSQMSRVLTGSELDWTIGNFFGRAIVNIILEFALWLIFYLIIKYFLYGVKYLIGKITKVVVFKTIDRIFGFVWSMLCTYVIVVGIVLTASEMIVMQFMPNFEATVAGWINGSVLLRFFHDTNVLGSFIANVMSVPLITIA